MPPATPTTPPTETITTQNHHQVDWTDPTQHTIGRQVVNTPWRGTYTAQVDLSTLAEPVWAQNKHVKARGRIIDSAGNIVKRIDPTMTGYSSPEEVARGRNFFWATWEDVVCPRGGKFRLRAEIYVGRGDLTRDPTTSVDGPLRNFWTYGMVESGEVVIVRG